MKKLIRLTEGDLHRIVKNSVKRALREMSDDMYQQMRDDFYNAQKEADNKLKNPRVRQQLIKDNPDLYDEQDDNLFNIAADQYAFSMIYPDKNDKEAWDAFERFAQKYDEFGGNSSLYDVDINALY